MTDRPATVRIAYGLVEQEVPLSNAIATLRAKFDDEVPFHGTKFLPGDVVLVLDGAVLDRCGGEVEGCDEDETIDIAYGHQVDNSDDTVLINIVDYEGDTETEYGWVSFVHVRLVDRRKSK